MSRLSKDSACILKLYNNGKWKSQLLWILCRDLRGAKIDISVITATINHFNTGKKKGSDMKIINKLRELVKKPENQYNEEYDTKRALRKVHNIKKNINRINDGVLDYGGNVGHFGSAIGKYYNIPINKRFVIDVRDWSGQKWEPRKDITFIEYKNQSAEDFKKQIGTTVDLISAFHVLHHIKKNQYGKIIDIFNNVLSADGKIVLYEHDSSSTSKNMAFLLDLEHCLFDVVVAHSLTFTKFVKGFYAEYMSIQEWNDVFSKYFIPYKTKKLNNANKSFYTYYRRK